MKPVEKQVLICKILNHQVSLDGVKQKIYLFHTSDLTSGELNNQTNPNNKSDYQTSKLVQDDPACPLTAFKKKSLGVKLFLDLTSAELFVPVAVPS